MFVRDIFPFLDTLAPFSYAMDLITAAFWQEIRNSLSGGFWWRWIVRRRWSAKRGKLVLI